MCARSCSLALLLSGMIKLLEPSRLLYALVQQLEEPTLLLLHYSGPYREALRGDCAELARPSGGPPPSPPSQGVLAGLLGMPRARKEIVPSSLIGVSIPGVVGPDKLVLPAERAVSGNCQRPREAPPAEDVPAESHVGLHALVRQADRTRRNISLLISSKGRIPDTSRPSIILGSPLLLQVALTSTVVP